MAARKPFEPTSHAPEKRSNQFNLRLTDSERSILETEAAKRGVTALNLIRWLITDGLRRGKRR